ncbi:MAG: ABC transporter ATP-binding protein, partial [Acidimicrobiaceae bacterium]|nr:ABC transporter ATP-binding protein [Acidimicrobiaceae bacterium]
RRLGRHGLEKIRGRDVAIVPQAAMSVLDPTMTVLDQVAESAALVSAAGVAAERAGELLSEVGLPVDRHRAFPHELSGGQRQRVVIAMAVANRPGLLIADEPTTGLDVVTQQAILDLLDELRRRLDFDLWLISHDLPLVASRADDLVVMYGGRVVESGPARAVVSRPQHPYTAMLLGAFPSLRAATDALRPVPGEVPDPRDLPPGCAFAPRCPHSRGDCDSVVPAERPVEGVMVACHHAPVAAGPDGPPGRGDDLVASPASRASTPVREAGQPALRLDDVRVVYPGHRRGRPDVTALDGVSLTVGVGESVAIIGRSAAGKSTIARLALGLVGPTSGSVELLGEGAAGLSRRALGALRRRVQMVFQDPYESLHPNMTVAELVGEPLTIAGAGRQERAARVAEALRRLGLVPVERFLNRHAGTLSGGQRQRVALARTLVASPELIVADEPASMLDASLRATVAAHLLAVRETLGATLVFITHDISLARLVADRIVVLREGRVVEDGPSARLLARPEHAETQALIDAAVRGQVPDHQDVAVDNAAVDRSAR